MKENIIKSLNGIVCVCDKYVSVISIHKMLLHFFLCFQELTFFSQSDILK